MFHPSWSSHRNNAWQHNSVIQSTILSTVGGEKTKDPLLNKLYPVIVQFLNVPHDMPD
jgi:hypothetical protein